MNPTHTLPTGLLAVAVKVALRAPSVHNTQPWRWRILADSIELYADWRRHLAATDPDRRDLLISCGAALHHLQVALAAEGWTARVHRLPDPEHDAHLATIEVLTGPGGDQDAELYRAIQRRRTDRRRFGPRPVASELLDALAERAEAAAAHLHPITDQPVRNRLAETMADAAQRQQNTPGYPAELRMWTSRYAGGQDGVPPDNVPHPSVGLTEPGPQRRFPTARLSQPPHPPGTNDGAVLVVLTTDGDDRLDQLRAGEAASAVLLAATDQGLSSTPLSQAVEVPYSRKAIREDILHVPEEPQLIIRLGWAAPGAGELPATPRRSLRSVLMPG